NVVWRPVREAFDVRLALPRPAGRLLEPGDDLDVTFLGQLHQVIELVPGVVAVDVDVVALGVRLDVKPAEDLTDVTEAGVSDHVHRAAHHLGVGFLVEEGIDTHRVEVGVGDRVHADAGGDAAVEVAVGQLRADQPQDQAQDDGDVQHDDQQVAPPPYELSDPRDHSCPHPRITRIRDGARRFRRSIPTILLDFQAMAPGVLPAYQS